MLESEYITFQCSSPHRHAYWICSFSGFWIKTDKAAFALYISEVWLLLFTFQERKVHKGLGGAIRQVVTDDQMCGNVSEKLIPLLERWRCVCGGPT